MRQSLRRGSALAALAVLAGCATTAPPAEPMRPDAPDRSALEALYWARQDSARTDFTPADVSFMSGMIGHHAQALILTRLAPTHGASPTIRTLASRITNAQNDEIESMQRWLRLRDQPVPTVQVDGLMLRIGTEGAEPAGGMDHSQMDHGSMDHGGMDHAMMPGMLTQVQLEELDRARGADFDRLFLRFMIQHHGGAVTMVNDLFAADGAAQDNDAFKMASDIHVDQQTEIARMESILRALPN